jgi:hypothetical protein
MTFGRRPNASRLTVPVETLYTMAVHGTDCDTCNQSEQRHCFGC